MRKRTFGTHDIAKICHVTPPTVGHWIDEGKIPFFKTGGGHRRVWDFDLVLFLREHNIPIPDDLEGLATLKVLVVDDDPDMRRFIVRVLRNLNPDVEIHEASDGFEAGHKISSVLPSLVILDICLPGMDGLKVCQIVRSVEKLKSMKILTITGFGVEESRANALKAGADDFLAKPFNSDELKEKLVRVLQDFPMQRSKREA